MKQTKPFATEADLCKQFIASLPEGWTPYAESCGWDILLVRNEDGFQIGIQAKLRLNTDVINQTLEGDSYRWEVDRLAPDCRAVLVPDDQSAAFGLICAYIGVTIIRVRPAQPPQGESWSWKYRDKFTPALPKVSDERWTNDEWYDWAPRSRHTLPAYVPDVVAGAPSPVQLTAWKIAAIKIAIILEKRGFVTRADFKHVGIDHRRWLPSGNRWLKLDGGVYRKSDSFPDFRSAHPRNVDEILADYETWKPADPIGPLPLPGPPLEPLL